MGDGIGLIVVLVALIGVVALLLGGRAGLMPGKGKKFKENPTGLLAAFVTTMGVTSFIGLNAGSTAPPLAGAALGVAFGVLSVTGVRLPQMILGAAAGVMGVTASIAQLLQNASCTGSLTPRTGVMIVLFAVVAAFALLHTAFLRRPPLARVPGPWRWLSVPLAAYAALEVVLFFALPFGIGVLDTDNVAAFIVGILGAIAMGALVGYSPALAVAAGSAMIVVTQLAVELVWGTTCAPASSTQLVAGVCFAVTFGLVRLLLGRLARR